MDKDRLVEVVKEWIQIDNEILKLQKVIREKRQEKKELNNILVDVMRNNEIDEFDISDKDGKLVYNKKMKKVGLTKKYMIEKLQEYYKNDPGKADALLEHLIENREEKVSETISRKKKK